MEKLRLGYIGCGFMAQGVHLPNFAALPDVELLLLRQVAAEVEVYRAGATQVFSRPVPKPSWSYRREAEHFVQCLHTHQPFRSSATDTRTDVRLFEDIYRQFLAQRGVL